MARNKELELARKARYRERHRGEIRAWNRAYATGRRRSLGIPAQGSPESTENHRHARKLTGPEHPNWKGDTVGYFALHAWLNRNHPRREICSRCGNQGDTTWAYLHHPKTHTRDIGDYVEMCRACHRHFDALRRRWTTSPEN